MTFKAGQPGSRPNRFEVVDRVRGSQRSVADYGLRRDGGKSHVIASDRAPLARFSSSCLLMET